MKRLLNYFQPDSPFEGQPKWIVHNAHHKMGTVWITRVLEAVGKEFGLDVQKCNECDQLFDETADMMVANHSQFSVDDLVASRKKTNPAELVATHMVRHPLDAIVSGFHYHLWTDEWWVHVPHQRYGGLTYQQHLKSITKEEGLNAEIERFAVAVETYGLRAWSYTDPRVLEMKYEDLIADEEAGFERVFSHYGFHARAVKRCVEIALTQSFDRVARLDLASSDGASSKPSHLRSGAAGQWKEELSPEHVRIAEEKFGDVIERMGYSTRNT